MALKIESTLADFLYLVLYVISVFNFPFPGVSTRYMALTVNFFLSAPKHKHSYNYEFDPNNQAELGNPTENKAVIKATVASHVE